MEVSNKYKILELLKEEELTVKKIAEKTEFNIPEIRVYVNRLMKDNLVKKVGKLDRYVIYVAIEKETLIDNLDTSILKKMIPKFIEFGIKLDSTTDKEDKRIMELIEVCL